MTARPGWAPPSYARSVWRPLAAILLAAGAAAAAVPGAPAATAVPVAAGPAMPAGERKVATRRLTESQYRNAVRDLLGPEIRIEGRFEPEMRRAGLLAIGRAELSVTTTGLEQYFAMAQSIADQTLDPEQRERTVGCSPRDPAAFDRACAVRFLSHHGERLFRRPLSEAELAARLDAVDQGTRRTGDFHAGLKLGLASLLVAPEFLFRIETAEPDPERPGSYRLDAFTKASRLSFLFWDAPPDAELLAEARSGRLHRPEALARQVDRLAASPRLEDGVRAFFADMLQLDQFEGLVKDTRTYRNTVRPSPTARARKSCAW